MQLIQFGFDYKKMRDILSAIFQMSFQYLIMSRVIKYLRNISEEKYVE